MRFLKICVAAVALTLIAEEVADAGCHGRGGFFGHRHSGCSQGGCGSGGCNSSSYSSSGYGYSYSSQGQSGAYPQTSVPSGPGGACAAPGSPVICPKCGATCECPKCHCPATVPATQPVQPKVGAVLEPVDALIEVNVYRARRGLRPFLRHEGLTAGALHLARHKATYCLSGHTSNDFQALPAGVSASAGGCDGSKRHPSEGFGACCMDDNHQYAGAATAIGPDGCLYCVLFVAD